MAAENVTRPVTEARPDFHSQAATGGERVKASMNMLKTDLEDLKAWAVEDGTTMTNLIQRGLVLLRFLLKESRSGSRIVLKREGEPDRELLIDAMK